MRKLSAALIILLGLANAALAQTVTNPLPNAGLYGAYNSSSPTCVAGKGCWLQTDINGVLKTTGSGGGGSSAVTQATVPWVVSGQGTAGTAATGVLTVQGIAAMTPFLTTTTLNAETTKVIGTVNQGTSPWVVSNGGTFAVQAAQATAASLNATVVGTGTFATQATLAAETTKVIGTVNQGTSPWVVNLTTIAGSAISGGATGQLPVNALPVTSGGLSVYNVQPAASDNHVVIKNGAGQVYKISATGNASQTTVQYIRLYNAGTGFNGCNSATNLIYQNAIPFNTGGAGLVDAWDAGIAFSSGISICITGGYSQTDTTNATASAMIVNIGYK